MVSVSWVIAQRWDRISPKNIRAAAMVAIAAKDIGTYGSSASAIQDHSFKQLRLVSTEVPDYEGELPRMDSNHDKVIQSLL